MCIFSFEAFTPHTSSISEFLQQNPWDIEQTTIHFEERVIDLLASIQTNHRTTIAAAISIRTDTVSDESDSELIQQVTSHLQPESFPSSTSLIGKGLEQGRTANPDIEFRTPISKLYPERVHELPAPVESSFYVQRRINTLAFDQFGERYFAIIEGTISISALPPKQRDAAYDDALTEVLLTNASNNDLGHTPRPCVDIVLQHYHHHLSRLIFSQISIWDLTTQYQISARRSYEFTMTTAAKRALESEMSKLDPSHVSRIVRSASHHIKAPRIFLSRRKEEREQRGISALLNRCEQYLKQDPAFIPVDWRSSPCNRSRWDGAKRGWMGLSTDDVNLEDERCNEKRN